MWVDVDDGWKMLLVEWLLIEREWGGHGDEPMGWRGLVSWLPVA